MKISIKFIESDKNSLFHKNKIQFIWKTTNKIAKFVVKNTNMKFIQIHHHHFYNSAQAK